MDVIWLSTLTEDDFGHGTEVAGLIASEEKNGKGITGVVGPIDVKILPVKVLNKNGDGSSNIIAKGIRYAVDAGADIINISIDFKVHDKDIKKALEYSKKKGVFVVVSSGNTNSNCDLYSPAGDDGAYTVAAVNSSLKKDYFSSYGSAVSVAAPGEDILTTLPGGSFDTESGTSMAAPIVAGIAAMIKAENPLLKPKDLGEIIDSTATMTTSKSKNKQLGYGLVNAYKAVLMSKNYL